MRFTVITLFPEMLRAITESGVTRRAVEEGLIHVEAINPRDFTQDKHRTVDDRPFGGGPGMLMKYQPLRDAILAAKAAAGAQAKVIYLSPQGRPLTQKGVETLVQNEHLIFLCGRYEGIDERVIMAHVDEEWSLGDFVLSGGELAAMAYIDAVSRLVPGVLGDERSAVEDSFTDGLLDCPHFTRPVEIDGMSVPAVLTSGNHAAIDHWRQEQALVRTWLRRPELLTGRQLTAKQQALIATLPKAMSGDDSEEL